MVFDWKNNKEEAKENGIYEDEVKCLEYKRIVMKTSDGAVSNHTFRNFEQLEFEEGALIENCIFEDCGDITFNESRINNCTFKNIKTISSCSDKITNSTFCDLKCSSDLIISLESGTISHCTFENAELRKDSLLIDGVGDSCVKNCTFKDIRTDRYDGEIIKGEDFVGKIFTKKISVDIVDKETCTGLEDIIIIE